MAKYHSHGTKDCKVLKAHDSGAYNGGKGPPSTSIRLSDGAKLQLIQCFRLTSRLQELALPRRATSMVLEEKKAKRPTMTSLPPTRLFHYCEYGSWQRQY
jgi:hypothetical protein